MLFIEYTLMLGSAYRAKVTGDKIWFWVLIANWILIGIFFSLVIGMFLPIIYLIVFEPIAKIRK